MTTKSAGEIIMQEYGQARNFMTPRVLRLGKISRNIAFELSTGRGIFDPDSHLFGVSVVTYNPETDTTDRHAVESKCFGNRAEADSYVDELFAVWGEDDEN